MEHFPGAGGHVETGGLCNTAGTSCGDSSDANINFGGATCLLLLDLRGVRLTLETLNFEVDLGMLWQIDQDKLYKPLLFK